MTTHQPTTQGSIMTSRLLVLSILLSAVVVGCQDDRTPEQQLEALRAERATIDEQIRSLERELADAAGNGAAVPVTAHRTKAGPFHHFIDIKGTVDSRTTIDVAPQMGGRVTALHVANGQYVQKGTLLIELDAEALRRNIAEVETQLDFAKTMFEKQKRIYEQKAGSEVQYLQAKTNKEALERRLEALNEQLEMMRITAPTAGYVDNLSPAVGEMAMPGMPILTIVNTGDMRVIVDLAESYMKTIDEGDSVMITIPELSIELAARIGTVSRTVNAVNRTFRVEIPLRDVPSNVRPNTTADVRINDITIDTTLSVPLASILREGNQQYVYQINDDGTVNKRAITTGLVSGGDVEVTSGIASGERVVVRGNQDVSDGDLVQVVE